MQNLQNSRIDNDVAYRSTDRSRGGSGRTHETTMKNLSYSIASLLLLIALMVPVTVSAQGPTTASAFTIQNTSGDQVTLGIPASSATYSLLFPSTPPVNGALFSATGTSGATDWVLPGVDGQILQIVSGLPVWSNVNLLPTGSTTNSTLIWDGTNWVENTTLTSNPTTGATNVGGDLTVTGPNVNLPAGSISNTELANSSINVAYGTGVSGDASVALGGTLNLANTGVTSIIGGAGISVSGATGAVTITSLGVGSIVGTPNQVIANTVLGVTTLSTPQDIHTGASPTFAGLNLTAVTGSSTSSDVLVLNGSAVETRTIYTLPGGSTTNSTLIWNGTNWVENTNVTLTPGGDIFNAGNTNTTGNTTIGGDLTVTGDVILGNGVINNNELQNSSFNVTYGAGLSGDASVTLGGTLNLNNTGVTAINGTSNQVVANTVAGVTTLSTPQDIHTGATPTFVGATLTGLTNDNTVPSVVVSDGGVLKTRAVSSLVSGSGGRISTAAATNGGGGWSMTITDAAVTATSPIIVSYEDPADGAQKSVHIGSRTGTSFTVHFAGKPASGSFVNYSVL